MADSHIILETHLFSNSPNGPPPWNRSLHLRLPSPAATKSDILTLIRDSVTRLGRADPVVEAQITLYFTRNGRVVWLPGNINTSIATFTLPIYQPAQIVNVNVPYAVPQPVPQQGLPGWPLAMTYTGGVNYLHSYGPGPMTVTPGMNQAVVFGGGQLGLFNVNVLTASGSGNRPIVSDVVREARLDEVAGEALTGLLEWAVGPTALKLIVVVDVNGTGGIPAVVDLPEPPAPPAPPAAG
ncbi:uncharacterized protein CTRU02_203378 [Colletotrichum truncatum]|uniref:Uncharacterized protein n=1 Tax=Colletotrichum truncatum TaxID=5467 RepID=A0ACC3Z955_COLTU|nr:uncharacterized protein CTRU02_05760 [Colletotrichum truncatum]KAF6793505.1 hypothetical protein CTRU02_05760 [Colletotrichum truncatum]